MNLPKHSLLKTIEKIKIERNQDSELFKKINEIEKRIEKLEKQNENNK